MGSSIPAAAPSLPVNLPPEPRLRDLKAAAQLLEPLLKVGKAGVSDAFLAALNQALDDHRLVKIRFDALKEEKKQLAPQIAERTGSRLIQRVGHVAVYYRAAAGAPEPGA